MLSATETAKRDVLLGRVVEATLGALDLLAIQLGLDLGLYQALRDAGPATSVELASRVGIDERYAREWLEHQAVGGVLTVDDAGAAAVERRYALPAGHAEVLLDLDSLAAAHSLPRFVVSAARTLPTIEAAYRSGDGVGWSDDPDLVVAQELANRPLFRHLLVQEWLPAVPEIDGRLRGEPPARIADLACGTGWSSIAFARGYP
ncbi:MAG: SAM-dependent methyltransferase, partial [Chloroflexi bacterium]|nr:SAM-dependent methyltransferase [Chloroflexota bacterium]